jgi:flagellin-like hook-associated protein FlgL
VQSLSAQRRVNEASSALSRVYERLSSGQRINRASDDSAGLAISSDLTTRTRVFTQAIRNGNDGLSALNIADGAIGELGSVVARIRELATQSANGSYSNRQRSSLDAEAQALAKEFSRIARSTEFNGVGLFDGSIGNGLRLQLGYGVDGSINTSVGGALGTGKFNPRSIIGTGGEASGGALGDLNGDGILDMVTADAADNTVSIMLGNGDGTFRARTSVTTGSTPIAVTLGDLNGDGVLDIVATDVGDDTASILLGNGDGTFRTRTTVTTGNNPYSVTLGDLNGDGVLDLVSADNGGATASIMLGNGDGTFRSRTTVTTGSGPSGVALGDLNGDGVLDIVTADGGSATASILLGNGDGTFRARTTVTTGTLPRAIALGDLNGDGVLDIVAADEGTSTVSIFLGNGNGTFQARTSIQVGSNPGSVSLGDLNGDGALDIVTSDYNSDTASIILGNGDGTFKSRSTVTTGFNPTATILGDLNGDGVMDLVTADQYEGASIFLAQTVSGLSPILPFSLRSRADALQSLGMLERTANNLVKQRGEIGAYQSRLGTALSTLESARENFQAAAARIQDADIASDTAALTRTQIIQQSAAAILAQANVQPEIALQLLQQ